MEIARYEGNGRLSKAVVHGGLLYTSGQTARTEQPDIQAQTRMILEKIEKILEANGSRKERILSATIYLADYTLYDEMNAVWDKWVAPGQEPARMCVGATLAPGLLLEIGVIAAV